MVSREGYEAYKKKRQEQERQGVTPAVSKERREELLKGYNEWKARTGRMQQDLENRVNALADKNQSFYKDYTSRFGNRNGTDGGKYLGDATARYNAARERKKLFDTEADEILGMFDQYGEYFDQDWMASVRDYLGSARTDQDQMLRDYAVDNQYWAGFGSEEGYLRYQTAQKGIEAYRKGQEEKEGQTEEKNWFEKALARLGSSGDSTLPGSNVSQVVSDYRKDDSYQNPTDQWTNEHWQNFGYLYETDPEKANEYAQQVNNFLSAQKKAGQRAQIQEKATDNFVGGAAHSIGALAASPFGLADYLDALAEFNARGTVTEKENITPFEYSQAVTEGVSKHLNEEHGTLNESIPVIGGKGWGDVYGLGTSIAQSTLSAYTGGSGEALVTFFGSAATSGMKDAKARGASDEQAITYGFLSGVAEAVPEMLSIESLMNIGSSETMRQFFVNVAKQGGAEALEEGMTSTLNLFADNIVNGDFSNMNILTRDYMAKGLDEDEAKRQAWKDIAEDIAYDMLSGFASGSIHAAPHTAMETYSRNSQISNVYGSSVPELIQQGLESAEGSLSHELAMKYQSKLDNGGSISGADINRLIKANEQQFLAEDAANIQQAAENRLTELGETGDLGTLAGALTKQVTKQRLSRAERAAIQNSQYGLRVANELDPQNIESEQYASGWAEQIGTSRIHDQAYNRNRAEQPVVEIDGEGSQADTLLSGQTTADTAKTFRGGAQTAVQGTTKTAPRAAEQADAETPGNVYGTEKTPSQGRYEVSDSGSAQLLHTGEPVSIRSVAEIRDGKMTLELKDGRKVSAEEISYANEDEALVYEAVAEMGVDATAANVLVGAYHTDTGVSAEAYSLGVKEAYKYGQYNFPMQEVVNGPFSSMLTDHQRNTAYRLGQMFSEKQTANAQATIKKSLQVGNGKGKAGKVYFDGDYSKLNERQRTSLSALETVADVLGVQIHVFESGVDADGRRTGANGWYDATDSSIHIDLHSGVQGKDTMLFTAAHELSHFIRDWSPAKFKSLADFLVQEYGKQGISVDTLVQNQITKAKRNGRDISYDTAFEEVVADSMETMLSDGKVAEKLAKLKTQDKALWEKLKDFFRGLAEKIRAAYKGLKPDSVEGRFVAEMKDAVEQLQELFTEGLTDAGENFQRAEKNTTRESGEKVRHSVRSSFADELQDWFDTTTHDERKVSGRRFLVGTTTDVLKSVGVKDYPIYFGGSKIDKILTGNASMSLDTIKRAVHLLEDPILIMQSRTVEDSIVLFGEVYTDGDKPVMISVLLNPKTKSGEILDYAVITSAYGRRSGNVQNLIDNSKIYYVNENKNRTEKWLQALGLQLPSAITNFGSISSISTSALDVKKKQAETGKKFSDRDQAMEKMNRVLTRENTKLKEDVGYLKEMLKLQRSVTGGTKFTKSSVEAMAGILMKNNSAKGSKPELAAHLNGLYEYIAKGEELTWEGVSEKAQPAVEWIQSHIESKPRIDEYATEILRKLRTSRVYLDESQKQEAAYLCGSYNDFRKRMLGTIVVSDKASVSLDTQWGELASLYPGVFDATTSASDMPRALIEAVDSLRGMNVIDEWYNRADVAQDLLRQVYDGYWKVSTLQTVADVKQKQINRLKAEHNTRMEKIKSDHREKIDRLKTEHHNELLRAKVRYLEAGETVSKNKQWRIIEKQVKDLTKMIVNPTKDAHVPTVLHKPLQKLLDSIDFTSKRSAEGGEATVRDVAYTRALQSIRTAIAAQRTAMEGVEDGAFALDVPPEFLDKINKHIDTIHDATEGMDLTTNRVYDMSADELKDLAYLLGTINKAVRNIDKLHMEGAKARVSELADSTVREMGQRKPVKGEDGGGLMWANYTPTYAFERMGTAATQILNGLKQGQAKMARTVDGVLKFAAKTYDAKEVKAWQEKIHTVKLESGETVKLTTAQIMSFYCLSNRDQGVGHLTGGGIRVGTIGEGPGKTVQKQHFRLTVQDINQINGLLDKRQLEVAKAMQKYMQDVGGRLGNEISMARWGFMQMTEENYFPIRSDSDVHDGKNPDQEKANLWALLNKSFTKSVTKGANDAVVVSSIFDVFADHMAEMAEYNAFALPLVDAMKWYNYRSTTRMDGSQIETVGVKKSLNDTLGTAAGKYFIDLMTDINSSQKGGRHEDIIGKLLSYSKASAVGWNLRVAIQQPTAILRASLYLDMPDLARGSLRIGTKGLVEEMQKYSGIAMWKSLGYYDLNVSRSVREQIKGNTNLVDTFNEWGMWLPGKVDEITWARIWAACKSKVSRTQNLKGEALLKETAKLFDDVVYHTQVVDSVLTKSSLMRSKSQIMKEFTSFMSEPTVSVNILMSAFQDYRQGKTKWEKAKRTFAICFKGYALSAMANALVTAFADAFRDDDEYEEFWEKYQQALLGEKFVDGNLFAELNPLEKLVFVKDALSLMRGYDVQNAYIKLVKGFIDLVDDVKKYFEGKAEGKKSGITEYGVIYNALKVLGNFTGAAPANLAREAAAIWNRTAGRLYPELKLYRYHIETKDKIHNALDAGALTAEEAIRELVLAQEAENEDEAYFLVKKWETKKDKYTDLYSAVQKDESIDAAMEELTSHGTKEKDALENVRDELKKWYTDPESEIRLTREETVSRLEKYTDMGSDEIQALVKKWDMELEAGFTYGELREQYVDGNISEKEAISYMQKYGGELKGDAKEKVLKWTCEKETGIAYDNLCEEYVNNRVSKDKVVAYLQKYGGVYKSNAEKTVREWTCEKETGIAYGDISSAYVAGKITASKAMDIRMLYGGYSREDAQKMVLEWQCEKDNGVKFDNIETAYKSGEISGSTAQKWLVKYGEQDPKDVAQKINAYDWQLAHPQYSLTVSQVISYTKQVEKLGYSIEYSGIDPETFVKYLNLSGKCKGTDSNGDGKTDSGSIKQEIMEVIHTLPISSKQKDALYLYNGWSEKTLWKAPWH